MLKPKKANGLDDVLFMSNAQLIVSLVSSSEDVPPKFLEAMIDEEYPVVTSQRIRYRRHQKKYGLRVMGTAQYVPVDVWALPIVDPVHKQNVVAYDPDYRYIVNVFGLSADGTYKLHEIRDALMDVQRKALELNATVAIHLNEWNDAYSVVKDVFEKSSVIVEVWQQPGSD